MLQHANEKWKKRPREYKVIWYAKDSTRDCVRDKGQKTSRMSTSSLREPVLLSLFKSYENHKRDKGQTIGSKLTNWRASMIDKEHKRLRI